MTYGDNATAIRQALGTLLRQHRIQQRIGGAGLHTVPVTDTPAERALTGEQIRRYRYGVLLWCHQAVATAGPEPSRALTDARTRAPAHELRYRLEQALQHDDAGLAPSEQLTIAQPFELVDLWRTAARAAALGEHDFAAVARSARFDSAQAMALLLDAAETASALVVLDRRYGNIPRWQSLHRGGFLAAASAACTALAARSNLDYSIDILGWRPHASVTGGPAKPGIAGVVQAEHNLLIHLDRLPTALNLKYVIDSQRALSSALAGRIVTTTPAVADSCRARALAYSRVFGLLRNVGGLIGDGGDAAAQGAIAVSRLQHIPPGSSLEDDSLHALAGLFGAVDARVAHAIEHGVRQHLYLMKTRVPEVEDADGNLVEESRIAFRPVTSPVQSDLVAVARAALGQPRRPVTRPSTPSESRRALRQDLVHRPSPPPNGLEGPHP